MRIGELNIRMKRSAAIAVLTGLLLIWGPTMLYAQAAVSREDQIKAAFLYKFLSYVERGPAIDASQRGRRICVVGKNQFGTVLHDLIKIQENPVNTTAVLLQDLSNSSQCSIVFIGRSEVGVLDELLKLANSDAVVTVSDIPNFAERGGIIELRREGNNLKFIINNSQAQRGEIKISAQLLALAMEII